MAKVTLPSVFTYRRSLDVTLGYMYQTTSTNPQVAEDMLPVVVQSEGFMGTLSNFEHRDKIEKLAKEGKNTVMNPQGSDVAYLGDGFDWLLVKFSIFPQCLSNKPMSSNSEDVAQKARDFVSAYSKAGGMKVLAEAYLTNVLSGRWLFRNDMGEKLVRVVARAGNNEELKVEASSARYDYSRQGLSVNDDDMTQLVDWMVRALTEPHFEVRLDVEGYVHLKGGKEIFPSQAYVNSKRKFAGEEMGREFMTCPLSDSRRQGILSTQKINNAIRTVDCWWGGEYALPADPFGPDRQVHINRRTNGDDFFSQVENNLEDWTQALNSAGTIQGLKDEGQMHFVVACLIRGGVYNGKGKK